MDTPKFRYRPLRSERFSKGQIIILAAAAVVSLAILGEGAWTAHGRASAPIQPTDPNSFRGSLSSVFQTWKRDVWQDHPRPQAAPAIHPQAQQVQPQADAAPVATPAPVAAANPAAVSTESLDSEVARVVPTLNKWTPAVLDASHMADYPSARMGELEGWKSGTFARNVADWQTMPDVPTLSGRYEIKQAAASDWPVAGSLAVEVVPTAGDPTGKSEPWRAVIFLAAPGGASDAVTYRYLLNSYGAPGARDVILGRANVPAVPVACERVGSTDGRTFYCVVPGNVTVNVAATEVVQHIRPQAAPVAQQPTSPTAAPVTDPTAARYAQWKAMRDAYAGQMLARAKAATTDAEKGEIQRDVARWKAANPEPAKPTNN